MAKMLVVVQGGDEPDALAKALLGQMPNSELPGGVKQIHNTAWTIELPKCSEFFATLLHNVKQANRVYVVAQLVDGIDPIVP